MKQRVPNRYFCFVEFNASISVKKITPLQIHTVKICVKENVIEINVSILATMLANYTAKNTKKFKIAKVNADLNVPILKSVDLTLPNYKKI